MPSRSPRPYERSIEDVVAIVRRAKEHDGAVILVGAGCSKTAGIPLAPEFCSIIKDRFPREYERASQRKKVGYQDLMAQIAPGECRDLLAEFIDKAKLNWAHIALAELIKQGYFARVLTPNFDPLVVQACALLNVFPAVYDLAASQVFKAGFVPTPAVFYLHGQRSGFRLLNTEHECAEHAEQLRPVFDEAGARRALDRGRLQRRERSRCSSVSSPKDSSTTACIGSATESASLPGTCPRNFSGRQDAFWVPGFDADQFLTQLAGHLGCFPPDLGAATVYLSCASGFDLIGTHASARRGG